MKQMVCADVIPPADNAGFTVMVTDSVFTQPVAVTVPVTVYVVVTVGDAVTVAATEELKVAEGDQA